MSDPNTDERSVTTDALEDADAIDLAKIEDDGEPVDVFLSYKRQDHDQVSALGELLRSLFVRVWYDGHLKLGARFPPAIEARARRAKAMLVFWTPEARESVWVHSEADIGLEKKTILPVKLRPVTPPAPFNGIETADLTGWGSDAAVDTLWASPEFAAILSELATRLGRPILAGWAEAKREQNADKWFALAKYNDDPLATTAWANGLNLSLKHTVSDIKARHGGDQQFALPQIDPVTLEVGVTPIASPSTSPRRAGLGGGAATALAVVMLAIGAAAGAGGYYAYGPSTVVADELASDALDRHRNELRALAADVDNARTARDEALAALASGQALPVAYSPCAFPDRQAFETAYRAAPRVPFADDIDDLFFVSAAMSLKTALAADTPEAYSDFLRDFECAPIEYTERARNRLSSED